VIGIITMIVFLLHKKLQGRTKYSTIKNIGFLVKKMLKKKELLISNEKKTMIMQIN
jgi:hypothetical protein